LERTIVFHLTKDHTFTRDVRVLVPAQRGQISETLLVTFRTLNVDEIARFDLDTGEGTTKFLRAIVVHVDDITDENDQAIPYSDALRDRVIVTPFVRSALMRCYLDAIYPKPSGSEEKTIARTI
jgi:hypothetical protein